jgi:hypothetical protein
MAADPKMVLRSIRHPEAPMRAFNLLVSVCIASCAGAPGAPEATDDPGKADSTIPRRPGDPRPLASWQGLGGCLDVADAADGTHVIIAPCTSSDSQLWLSGAPSGGSGPLIQQSSGKCLSTVPGGDEGSSLMLKDCVQLDTSQGGVFFPAPDTQLWAPRPDGTYENTRLGVIDPSDRCITGPSAPAQLGVGAILSLCSGDSRQGFKAFDYVADATATSCFRTDEHGDIVGAVPVTIRVAEEQDPLGVEVTSFSVLGLDATRGCGDDDVCMRFSEASGGDFLRGTFVGPALTFSSRNQSTSCVNAKVTLPRRQAGTPPVDGCVLPSGFMCPSPRQ